MLAQPAPAVSTAAAPENLLTEWSRLLFDSLAAAGVRNVVVSPGSRSTPFLLTAIANPKLTVQNVIDERAAAFFALGQARATGQPTVLLCTSGTAAGHYLPAVLEADQAGIPLIILTADRPVELLHVGANQTIDQRMLFEGYARRVVDLGAPDAAPSALRGLRRLAAQAVALTKAPHPGPVHLNARARKPLEPLAARSQSALALEAAVRDLCEKPAAQAVEGALLPDPEWLDELARRCMDARRGVIVAGPAPVQQESARPGVQALAAATGFPVLAEAASQLRFTGGSGAATIDAFNWMYQLPPARDAWCPDLVIQLGAPPTAPGWERFLESHPDLERIVIAPTGWPDPHATASMMVHGEIGKTCAALAEAVLRLRGDAPLNAFAARLAEANQEIRQIVEGRVAQGPLSEAAVARTVTTSLSEGAWLVLGNSLPIRTVDNYCPGPLRDVHVLSQRGVSGIDGQIAGAAGTASVAGRPVVLLVGDVSFLHDLGGLALGHAARVPLVVVVVNNGGGRIFEQLPVARSVADDTMRYFTTPQDFDLELAARLFRHEFARVGEVEQLKAALAAGLEHPGCTVVEAVVPPHGASEMRASVLAALQERYAT